MTLIQGRMNALTLKADKQQLALECVEEVRRELLAQARLRESTYLLQRLLRRPILGMTLATRAQKPLTSGSTVLGMWRNHTSVEESVLP